MANELKVDALAVMDRDAELALNWNGRAKESSMVAYGESKAARAAVAELIRVGERTRAALPVLSGLIHGMYGPESGGVKKAELLVAELDAALASVQGVENG